MEKIRKMVDNLLVMFGRDEENRALVMNAMSRVESGDLASAYWILHGFVLGCENAHIDIHYPPPAKEKVISQAVHELSVAVRRMIH